MRPMDLASGLAFVVGSGSVVFLGEIVFDVDYDAAAVVAGSTVAYVGGLIVGRRTA